MRVLIGVFLLQASTAVNAQMIDYAVEGVGFFPDVKVEIVDFFPDEKWQVVGSCSNSPNLKVEFVDFFPELKVEIVDFFPDRTICITNADGLDEDLLRKLKLID